MKKFEGFLFCTDLDGTLYRDDKTISKENSEAIEYFKSEGGLFTFITGRVPKTSTHIYETIKPNAPFGCFNGGAIYNYVEEKYLWCRYVDESAIELVRAVDEAFPDMGIQYNTANDVIFCKNNLSTLQFRQITGMPNLCRKYEEITEPVIKIVFANTDVPQIEALEKMLNAHPLAERFDFIRSEKTLYEILPKGVSKGALLQKLAELLNIDIKKTVAVGDYNNDISMIRTAGIGFAVANAVPEAKAVADHITVSNNEHAIAAIINGLDRGEYACKMD